MKVIVLIDWDHTTGEAVAETYGQGRITHFTGGLSATSDKGPAEVLRDLANLMEEADSWQVTLSAIDAGDEE